FSEAARQNKAQAASDSFLVAAHGCQQLLYRPGLRRRGQLKEFQEPALSFRQLSRNQTAQLGQTAGADHARSHRFPMQPRTVTRRRLESVREGVSVVQHGTEPRLLTLVLFDHVGLEPAAARHDVADRPWLSRQYGLAVLLQVGEQFWIEDDSILD